ncbi:uncharacterized protein LOC108866849 [Pyrus x bretschneideri]|uniref:uncharacterized protein LOC108866849 n=1 Tax=Pyrus x bretschneideri TaxID=225117 RepID=UPI00202FCBDE|nr:uncharacterized protein LOC108866849 [Pyrus x bretschneideri]
MVWSSANRNPTVAMASAQNQSAMWISSTNISNEPIWTAMAGLVAMTLWLSSKAPVSPNRSLLRYAHADQRETGLLGRAEFYNALRLDTVAQSERELTLEMLKASLYGPAAAKIPAPKINLAATPAPQFNSAAAAPATQGGAVTPTSS